MNAADRKRQTRLLALLALLLVPLLITYRGALFGGSKPQASAPGAAVGALPGTLASLGQLPGIPLEKPDSGDDYRPVRNLFDFSQSPDEIAAQKARKEAAERARVEAEKREKERQVAEAKRREEERINPPPPPPPPKPVPPSFDFSYTGLITRLTEQQEQLAVLQKKGTAPGAEPLIVKLGETIDNKFVVQKIDLDTLVIGYTDPRFRDQTQTVRLQGATTKKR
ncbi:MAG: hypothetical protein KBD01_17955 [Acidobacteria bacterium]|nr:hypothetical protein [Acidobacteriota bacterium]